MFWLPCWFHQMKEMRGERKESKSKESVFFFLPCSSYSSILPDETWCFCTLKYTSNSGYKRAALLWRNFPMLQSLHNKSSSQQLGSHVFEEKANDTFVWPQRYNIKKKVAIIWHQYLQSFWSGHPAYCLFSSMWWGNHFYSPNKRNIEFPMHSKSFVKGTKMAVVTSGQNQ